MFPNERGCNFGISRGKRLGIRGELKLLGVGIWDEILILTPRAIDEKPPATLWQNNENTNSKDYTKGFWGVGRSGEGLKNSG